MEAAFQNILPQKCFLQDYASKRNFVQTYASSFSHRGARRRPLSGAFAANLCFQPCKPLGEVTKAVGTSLFPFRVATIVRSGYTIMLPEVANRTHNLAAGACRRHKTSASAWPPPKRWPFAGSANSAGSGRIDRGWVRSKCQQPAPGQVVPAYIKTPGSEVPRTAIR